MAINKDELEAIAYVVAIIGAVYIGLKTVVGWTVDVAKILKNRKSQSSVGFHPAKNKVSRSNHRPDYIIAFALLVLSIAGNIALVVLLQLKGLEAILLVALQLVIASTSFIKVDNNQRSRSQNLVLRVARIGLYTFICVGALERVLFCYSIGGPAMVTGLQEFFISLVTVYSMDALLELTQRFVRP